ncbi:MAG: hypothetical protein ACE5G8_13275, partial [Anaerolineae bacterium]
ILKEQAALQGFSVDPRIPMEIAGIEEELQQLQAELAAVSGNVLFSRFWQIDEKTSLLCVISYLRPRLTPQYWRPMTGFGEIQGLSSIYYSLDRAFENVPVEDDALYFGTEFPRVGWKGSIIILGGDDNNDVMKAIKAQFLKKGDYKLPIDFEYETLLWKDEPKVKCKGLVCRDDDGVTLFEPKINQDQNVDIDYGLIARFPNPFNFQSKLFIFAGCHTYGTAAAARVVASKPILQTIERECPAYSNSEFFAAAVRCSVNEVDRHYFNVDGIEVFYPLALDQNNKLQFVKGIKKGIDFPAN